MQLPPYLSGPISFAHFKIKGDDLLIFGDSHYSHDGMCQNCDFSLDKNADEPVLVGKISSEPCYTLSAWIKKILDDLKGTKQYLDLYVEDYFSEFQEIKEGKKVDEKHDAQLHYDGRLGELIRVYAQCKTCENMRYHFLDTRTIHISDKPYHNFTDDLIHSILNDIFFSLKPEIIHRDNLTFFHSLFFQKNSETMKSLVLELNSFLIHINEIMKEYCILCALSTNYSQDIRDFVLDYVNDLSNEPKTYYDQTYFVFFDHLLRTRYTHKKYMNQDLHPIGKQFRKLLIQEQYQGNMNHQISKMAKVIIDFKKIKPFQQKDYEILYDELSQIDLSKESINSEEITEIIEKKIFFTYFMDLYAIPRILFQYSDSKLKIYSAGNYHTSVLIEFLTIFYPGNEQKRIEPNNEYMDRCLYLYD